MPVHPAFPQGTEPVQLADLPAGHRSLPTARNVSTAPRKRGGRLTSGEYVSRRSESAPAEGYTQTGGEAAGGDGGQVKQKTRSACAQMQDDSGTPLKQLSFKHIFLRSQSTLRATFGRRANKLGVVLHITCDTVHTRCLFERGRAQEHKTQSSASSTTAARLRKKRLHRRASCKTAVETPHAEAARAPCAPASCTDEALSARRRRPGPAQNPYSNVTMEQLRLAWGGCYQNWLLLLFILSQSLERFDFCSGAV